MGSKTEKYLQAILIHIYHHSKSNKYLHTNLLLKFTVTVNLVHIYFQIYFIFVRVCKSNSSLLAFTQIYTNVNIEITFAIIFTKH